jgi:gliding motility-associated-like protein
VDVTLDGTTYTDDGSFNGEKLSDELLYCYFVTTFGSYGNDSIAEPLINNSQVICAQPNDTIPPCPPISLDFVELGNGESCEDFLAGLDCDFDEWVNELVWDNDGSAECTDDIRSYNVYYSRTGREEDFEFLANTTNTGYLHNRFSPIPLLSFAGCYQISAVDRSGNESEFSEVICRDNCPYFELPNVFTPNNDGVNETWRADDWLNENGELLSNRCPRFVENVKVVVYNRHGKQVYTFNSQDIESDILNWDGTGDNGQMLSAGVYFYVADVTFTVLDPEKSVQKINGWVHILY